jgi:hypothetical protein
MNEQQEKQWLYAKSLEIAALMQGQYRDSEINQQTAVHVILHYETLRCEVEKRIREARE